MVSSTQRLLLQFMELLLVLFASSLLTQVLQFFLNDSPIVILLQFVGVMVLFCWNIVAVQMPFHVPLELLIVVFIVGCILGGV